MKKELLESNERAKEFGIKNSRKNRRNPTVYILKDPEVTQVQVSL